MTNNPTIDKNYLITFIYNSKSINATLNKVQPIDLRDDFKQFIFLELLKIDFEKLLAIYNKGEVQLEAYAGGLIRKQLMSNNSSFHRTFRKNLHSSTIGTERLFEIYNSTYEESGGEFYSIEPSKIETVIGRYHPLGEDLTAEEIERKIILDKNYDRIISFLNHIHPKKSRLFIEHYVNGKTLREISAQYNIKYRTVHNSIRTTEQLIRDNLKFEND